MATKAIASPAFVQANILKPHGRAYTNFIFFTFREGGDSKAIREFVKNLVDGGFVSSHRDQVAATIAYRRNKRNQKTLYTFGVTWRAAVKMKLNNGQIPLDGGFLNGMAEGGRRLNDYDDEREEQYVSNDFDACLCIADDRMSIIEECTAQLLGYRWFESMVKKSSIVQELGFMGEKTELGRRGPLGYVDGISERRSINETARVALVREGRVQKVATGTINLPFGSFMAFRKIEVYRDNFEKLIDQLTDQFDDSVADKKALAYAMIMGRSREGLPLAFSDGGGGLTLADFSDLPFDYQGDPTGSVCPFHAHIRVMNRRQNGPAGAGIVRRGYNYALSGANTKASRQKNIRGILFVSFQRSITEQFEPLFAAMRRSNGEDALAYTPQQDNILRLDFPKSYRGDEKFTTVEFRGQHPITKFRGGEYFYFPSFHLLRNL